jgi:ketosteroid isomerase-like protein
MMLKPLRTVSLCVGILCLAWLPGPASGQPDALSPPTGTEADHEALRRIRAAYEQAIREKRIDALRPHLHADFHGVMVTARPVDSFDDLQQYWRDINDLIGEGGTYTTTVNPEFSDIVGDVALARGTTDDVVVTSEGQEFRFQSLWTAVLQKQDGEWKIRRVQGSMDPVENPFVSEFMRRAIMWTAVIGAGAGILFGLAIGIVWGRRNRRPPATP